MVRNEATQKLKRGTVIPAIPLALTHDRQFDEDGQRMLIRYYLRAGAGGIAACVHTTQFEIRLPKHNLFEMLLKVTAEEIDAFERETQKIIVRIAGVCGDTAQAMTEAQTIARYGYDAVLLSPGGLSHLTENALIERTRNVADILPVIGFYLQTAVGGRRLSYDYWRTLCEIDQLIAIKCASFNRYSTLDVVRAVALSPRSDAIALYTGNDDNIVIDLLTEYVFTEGGITHRKRFVGGLLGHWSVWTHTVVKQFAAIKSATAITPELLSLAAEITDANGALFDVNHDFKGCIAGIHEILRRQGLLKGSWCLSPDERLSPGQSEEIDRVLSMYPHLTDDAFVAAHIANRFK